jgi:hypothetical protein
LCQEVEAILLVAIISRGPTLGQDCSSGRNSAQIVVGRTEAKV